MHGFDQHYFVQQVAGLAQLAGEFMLVHPRVIQLGWGSLKSALAKLPDSAFTAPPDATVRRQSLIDRYIAAFRYVEAAALWEARAALETLSSNISQWIVTDQQPPLRMLVQTQEAVLS